MRHTRIKKVITKKGEAIYYKGDGLWFGRIARSKAEKGLASGEYTLFESVNKWAEQYI